MHFCCQVKTLGSKLLMTLSAWSYEYSGYRTTTPGTFTPIFEIPKLEVLAILKENQADLGLVIGGLPAD